ncbi:C40 family peptidase [Streptomyces sp. SudanB182_2057]|uniref:C40 family peptidase n=1 Tax=Streptomyces sp. SudanB182_2057 TaxID=3035281 RepID=UPI003F5782A6
MAFVLSLLAGVLLAVHGPSGSPSADRPAVALQPEGPSAPEPARTKPTETTETAEPAEEDTTDARSVKVEKVTLRPGDSLWALARTHGTSVKALQQLNDLGSTTLIYAGRTLQVPAQPDSSPSVRQSKAAPSAPAQRPDGRPGVRSADKPAKPTKPTKPAKRAAPVPNAVVAYAKGQQGKPYVWGGTGPRGFDCSGLVMRAWQAAGVTLPRTTWDQIHAGTATTRGRLVPGDLVLSYGGGHVGLYIGNGQIIHAPKPGTTVTTAPLPAPGNVVAYRHIRP